MPSPPGTRVSRSALLAIAKEPMTLDISGHTLPTAFAYYDPNTHSLKTSQLTLDLGLTPSSVTLPRSGLMRNGQLYERPTLGRATSGTGSSSLLPTPVVNDMGAGKTPDEWAELTAKWQAKFNNNGHGNSLSIEIAKLPTPTARDSKGVSLHYKHKGEVNALPDAINKVELLPTPRTSDTNGPGVHGNGGMDLRTTVDLLPTPTSQASKHGSTPDHGANGFGHNLWDLPHLLPTPRERDHKNAAASEQTALDRIDRGYGLDIAEAIQLLPTPRAMTGGGDNTAGQDRPSGHKGTTNLHGLLQNPKTDWGKYAPAIERWAEVIDRPAPEPTDDKGRLNPALVEWMMGYPKGWTEGVSRTGQLKALGNSIVPHQAAAAWGHLLGLNVFAALDGEG